MITLEIRSPHYHYQALLGSQLLDRAGELMAAKVRGTRCALISDTNIAAHFAGRVEKSLTAAGFQPTLITVAAGEEAKNLAQAGAICDRMMAARLDRTSLVVGLGGGVIGDLSGFVAAIFQRGIPHVQIPTTLLAMVDSSIGGKTGVNTRDGKNLIGAVHHPTLVIDDVDLLQTLPRREFNQGFAEIIKHAVIADAEMFSSISVDLDLTSVIRRNIELKARIVSRDESDRTGERAIINFGHTIGHAIEQASDYKQFLHGEAVGLGMIAAAMVSGKRAGLPSGAQKAIVDLLKSFHLPVRLPKDFPREKIMDAVVRDKKFEGGQVRFVVTPQIGSAALSTDVTLEDIRSAVAAL